MPILLVKVSGKKSAQTTQAISELLFDLTTRILKKRRDVMSVVIDYVEHDSWMGRPCRLVVIGRFQVKPGVVEAP